MPLRCNQRRPIASCRKSLRSAPMGSLLARRKASMACLSKGDCSRSTCTPTDRSLAAGCLPFFTKPVCEGVHYSILACVPQGWALRGCLIFLVRAARHNLRMDRLDDRVSGRSLLSANQTTSFFLVSGLGSGAYSAKLLNGTRHRFSGFNQPRQWGELVLRMFVTGGPPVRGGGGMPHRIRGISVPRRCCGSPVPDNQERRRAWARGCRHSD